MNIKEKLQILKRKDFDFQSDKEEVKRWEIEVLNGLALNSVNEKAGIEMMRERFNTRIGYINDKLLYDLEMTIELRKALIHVRDEYNNLIKIFEKIDLSHIEEEIDQNLDI